MRERIVFLGSGSYIIPIVEMLTKHGFVAGITTEKEGKLVGFLKKENIPFITTEFQNEEDIEKLKAFKPTLGVLASYGVILKPKIINMFPKGIINIHPSLLPKHKGPTPIQATIMGGDTTTGVTIHMLDEIVDHGPILAQKEVHLSGNETTEDLKNLLFKLGADVLEGIITKLEKGEKLEEKAQIESREYTPKLLRESGFIDINNPPDQTTLNRLIRAYYPWPGAWFTAELLGKKRRVKLLPKNKIQVEGAKVMHLKDFVNGYQKEAQLLLSQLGLLRAF